MDSMMIPGLVQEPPEPEEELEKNLLLEILKTVSRLEGMILAQQRGSNTPAVGIPPMPSSQLDLPPIMF